MNPSATKMPPLRAGQAARPSPGVDHSMSTPEDNNTASISSPEKHLIRVGSSAPYHALQDALAKNTFARDADSIWPVARLKGGRTRGTAQLMPAVLDQVNFLTPEQRDALLQAMWEQRKDICDLDADALDALSALWIQKSNGPDAGAVAEIDELLLLRGLRRHRGGHGRRGGFTNKQRTTILGALSRIHNLWLTIESTVFQGAGSRAKRKHEVVQSRPFVITDTLGQLRFDGYVEVHKFIFRPGSVFAAFLWGPTRLVALLSAKALHYHPHRQTWEKRLSRYFSWQWRIRARSTRYEQPYAVRTLLEVVGERFRGRNAKRLKARFERALNTLNHDEVIAAWRYGQDFLPSEPGWAKRWLESSIVVEPPGVIRSNYDSLRRGISESHA
jgi:hypothetical protein